MSEEEKNQSLSTIEIMKSDMDVKSLMEELRKQNEEMLNAHKKALEDQFKTQMQDALQSLRPSLSSLKTSQPIEFLRNRKTLNAKELDATSERIRELASNPKTAPKLTVIDRNSQNDKEHRVTLRASMEGRGMSNQPITMNTSINKLLSGNGNNNSSILEGNSASTTSNGKIKKPKSSTPIPSYLASGPYGQPVWDSKKSNKKKNKNTDIKDDDYDDDNIINNQEESDIGLQWSLDQPPSAADINTELEALKADKPKSAPRNKQKFAEYGDVTGYLLRQSEGILSSSMKGIKKKNKSKSSKKNSKNISMKNVDGNNNNNNNTSLPSLTVASAPTALVPDRLFNTQSQVISEEEEEEENYDDYNEKAENDDDYDDDDYDDGKFERADSEGKDQISPLRHQVVEIGGSSEYTDEDFADADGDAEEYHLRANTQLHPDLEGKRVVPLQIDEDGTEVEAPDHHDPIGWENQIARHILSMYATTKYNEDEYSSKVILDYADADRAGEVEDIKKELEEDPLAGSYADRVVSWEDAYQNTKPTVNLSTHNEDGEEINGDAYAEDDDEDDQGKDEENNEFEEDSKYDAVETPSIHIPHPIDPNSEDKVDESMTTTTKNTTSSKISTISTTKNKRIKKDKKAVKNKQNGPPAEWGSSMTPAGTLRKDDNPPRVTPIYYYGQKTEKIQIFDKAGTENKYRTQLKVATRDGRVVTIRGLPKVYSIWFMSAGDIYSDWTLLPAGQKLQAQLAVMLERKRYHEYIGIVETLMETLWAQALDREGGSTMLLNNLSKAQETSQFYGQTVDLLKNTTGSRSPSRAARLTSATPSPNKHKSTANKLTYSTFDDETTPGSKNNDPDMKESDDGDAALGRRDEIANAEDPHGLGPSIWKDPIFQDQDQDQNIVEGGEYYDNPMSNTITTSNNDRNSTPGNVQFSDNNNFTPHDYDNSNSNDGNGYVEDINDTGKRVVQIANDPHPHFVHSDHLSLLQLVVLWKQLVITANAFACLALSEKRNELAMSLLQRAQDHANRNDILTKKTRIELKGYVADAMSFYYYRLRKPSAAQAEINKAERLLEKCQNYEAVAIAKLHRAAILVQLTKYRDAHKVVYGVIAMVEDGRLAFEEASPKQLCIIAVAYHNLAVVQMKLEMSDLACKNSMNARKIARLCLSFSNRWLHIFQYTHECALEDAKYQLSLQNKEGQLDDRQLKVMKELTEAMFDSQLK